MKKALFHIHSSYSYDCTTRVDKIVNLAVKNKIDFLTISDHESLRGSLEARKYALKNKLDIHIPIAGEYFTDVGDIIVLNVPENFKETFDHRILCKEAKRLGGCAVLPHPYKGHKIESIDFSDIDFIEVFNSRCSPQENEQAVKLAKNKNKKNIFGSDAHFTGDIIKVVMAYEGEFLKGNTNPVTLQYTTKDRIILSETIKAAKNKDFISVAVSILRLAKYYAFGIINPV